MGVGTSEPVEIFVDPGTDAMLPTLCNDSFDGCFFNGLGGTETKLKFNLFLKIRN